MSSIQSRDGSRFDAQTSSTRCSRIHDAETACPVGFWTIEPVTGAVQFDADAQRMLDRGQNEPALRWADLQAAVTPNSHDALQHQLAEMPFGRDCGFVEFTLGLRSGAVRELRAQWSRQRGLVMGVLVDVSSAHRAAAAEETARTFEVALHAAETAARERSRLLATLGHELRNPLNAVLGFGHLLCMAEGAQHPSEQRLRWLNGILHAGRSMTRLVDDLVALGCAESRSAEADIATQPLLPCLKVAWELARAASGGCGVAWHPPEFHDVEDDTLVMFDAGRLQQVVMNLLCNAVKYNRPGGSVWICVRLQADQCVIDIRDDGLGIAARHVPHLFTPFFRADREGCEVPGIGLGLAVSNALIVAMRGTLEAESVEGQGSTFHIHLPLALAHQGVDRADLT